MKKLIAVICLLISTQCYAGFITGYIVGSTTSGGSTSSQGSDTAVISDKYDVITCCRASKFEEVMSCEGPKYLKNGERNDKYTLEEFANKAGYKTIHRVGFLSRARGCDMIIMEVSK